MNPGSSAHPLTAEPCSGSLSGPAKSKTRLLRKEERCLVQDMNKAAIIMQVTRSVPTSLAGIVSISRMQEAISDSEELKVSLEPH